MSNSERVRWRCPNRDCNWSTVPTVTSGSDPAPRCICGALMHKARLELAFNYLDFLHDEPAANKELRIKEE